jgi:WD40 repeat protein
LVLPCFPDGKTVVSGSYDNMINIWDVDSGDQKALMQGHTGSVYSLVVSPKGTIVRYQR